MKLSMGTVYSTQKKSMKVNAESLKTRMTKKMMRMKMMRMTKKMMRMKMMMKKKALCKITKALNR